MWLRIIFDFWSIQACPHLEVGVAQAYLAEGSLTRTLDDVTAEVAQHPLRMDHMRMS